MNRVEKTIYNLVKHNPRLKLAIRNQYQRILDLLPTPAAKTAYPITNREGYFFGFHDHTPFSADNKLLLAHRYTIPLRMPLPGETLDVGFFHGDNFDTFQKAADTRAWTWHMGSKLQWRGKTKQLVFNDHLEGRNIARMIDVYSGAEKVLPDSIGSVSPNGKWAVGYSFFRVAQCMPGYGYHYDIGDKEAKSLAPEQNGIHIINLETGDSKLLFSIAEMAEKNPEAAMKGAMHFFSHTVFSPDSNRFIFLHRWTKGDVEKRWSRMISADIKGENIYIFPTTDMVSHIGWKDAEHVLAYCRTREHDDQYVVFKDQDPGSLEVIGQGVFTSDGHPSIDNTGNWMVTDTYPNRRRVQYLALYNLQNKTRYDICHLPMPKKFQSPSSYKHWSCDLHPRWDRTGRYLCFDATYTGQRALCTIDLGDSLANGQVRYLRKVTNP